MFDALKVTSSTSHADESHVGGHNGDYKGQHGTARVARKRGRPLGAKSKRIELKRCDAVDREADDAIHFVEFAIGTNAETWNIQTARPTEESFPTCKADLRKMALENIADMLIAKTSATPPSSLATALCASPHSALSSSLCAPLRLLASVLCAPPLLTSALCAPPPLLMSAVCAPPPQSALCSRPTQSALCSPPTQSAV